MAYAEQLKNPYIELAHRLKPHYTHDCADCHFLGHFEAARGMSDLYVHCSREENTVIARFGHEGPDYVSGLCFSYGAIAELTEARHRAEAAGLMEYSVYEALRHVKLGTPEFEELKNALSFTEEYQAYLAFTQGNVERSRGLITHLMQLEVPRHERADQDRKTWSRALTALNSHLVNILEIRTGMRAPQSWGVVQDLTEFLWQRWDTRRAA